MAGLDGLRAIAVLAVVAFHAGPGTWLRGGYLGVDVFFVLSGFLITALLAAEHDRIGRIALGAFYLRRFLRLMPALGLLVAAYVVLAPMLWPATGAATHWRDGLVALTYLSDYAYAIWQVPGELRHTWSLAVEEHFYLLWPLVLPAVLRLRDPARWVLVAYGLAAVWRAFNYTVFDWQLAYYRFDTRVAGLLLGCWLALWLRDRTLDRPGEPLPTPPSPLVAITALLAMFATTSWMNVGANFYALPLVEAATVCLILGVLEEKGGQQPAILKLLSSRPFQQIGLLSYGIYLWHFPISLLTRHSMPYWQSLLVSGGGGIVLAWISYHSVEAAGRQLRRRFEARKPVEISSCGLQPIL